MADRKKKKSKFSLRKLVYNDKYLIIISVILAVVVWIATTMNLSPETTKTVTVPVAVDFKGSVAEQLGLKCFSEESFDVNVTLSCKKYLAKDITADDISVSLEKNAVTASGFTDVPIKVDTDNAEIKVVSYYPSSYRALFDVEDERTMDINIEYTNDSFIEEGYMMGEPLLSESTANISGPRSYVSQIDKLVAKVGFNEKLKATTSTELDVNAVDKYGNNVSYININSSVDGFLLTVPVLKEMNLDVSTTFTGKPSKLSTSDFDISYSTSKVNAGVLDEATTTANIGSIDFSKLNTGKNKFTFDVDKLNGLVVLDNISNIDVTVVVPSTYKSTALNVAKDNAEVINMPEGYKATITGLDSTSVKVIGPSDKLKELITSNVRLVVDFAEIKAEDIKEGVTAYTAIATIEKSDSCWVYGTYKVYVDVSKT